MKKIVFLLFVLFFCVSIGAQEFPYRNANLGFRERVQDLLSRLTLEEKSLLMRDRSGAVPRLGIKKFYWWSEALHGVVNEKGVTVFPEPVGMAATFDDSLVYRVFGAVSDEGRAEYNIRTEKGVKEERGLSVWAPNVNIFRDPRWGRGQETYGEDPYLTSRMGIAVVRGLQGPDDSKYRKLYACAKHFAVHSGPEWNRHTANLTDVSPRDLWETYLPAFKALVQEAKVREVMCAYQSLDDEPCCGNNRLLQEILREGWGFKYIVVSDCGAISDFWRTHKSSSDAVHAAAKASSAGTDVECGDENYKKLPEAVARGLVSEKEIDKHLMRILAGRFELGEMDDPTIVPWSKIPSSVINSKEHQDLALETAQESMALLQNRNHILPLSKKIRKIAVVGPNADEKEVLWGNYNGTPVKTVTILEGIKSKLPAVRIVYDKGCDLINDTIKKYTNLLDRLKGVDVVVFAGGISSRLEREEMPINLPGFKGGDRTDIELPASQRKCLEALKAAGKKVIFVDCSGSAMGLVPETQSCEAILQAWYGGEAGGQAVADVLFGDYNPSGKLPVTFYKNAGQLPAFENYSMKGRTYRYMVEKPLYPFGYGLSYTTFSLGKAELDKEVIKSNETAYLTVAVRNTGKRAGAEVVQVYVKKAGDREGPLKTLRAFERVVLGKGQVKRIRIVLPPSAFKWFDKGTNTMNVLPGKYELMYGTSSADEDLKKTEITII